jgi:raffinose/stachyose/melibiose transport system substrate-binding protein
MTTQEFAELYSNALPGFFTLSNYDITLDDPIANEFLSWRQTCESTIRNSYQILSRGDQQGAPNLENELWRVTAAVMNGTMTPEEAGEEIQAGLDQWYTPE